MKKNAQKLYLLLYRTDERKYGSDMGCVGVYLTPKRAQKEMKQEYRKQCRALGHKNVDAEASTLHSKNASIMTKDIEPDQYEWTIVPSVVPLNSYRRAKDEFNDDRAA